ncbi:hypothetical protein MTR_0099s0120 [Medicago truncatula]|uniref:Uncharacterized protein n=1 Tax=Medicago truncatula TaxID=3880 RepID=A0A072TH84_MEDTR|nr:hypothetical protein MTR_0099s0120 [Medicago truncatula]
MYLKSKRLRRTVRLVKVQILISKWGLVFDGAVNAYGKGIGAVIVSPTGASHPFLPPEFCSNVTKQIWLSMKHVSLGFEEAIDMRNQNTSTSMEILHSSSIRVKELHHIPRDENQMADALDTLSFQVSSKPLEMMCQINQKCKRLERTFTCVCYWGCDRSGASNQDKKTLRRLASRFMLDGDILAVNCMMYMTVTFGDPMEHDCYQQRPEKCHKCQIYADKIHVPPHALNVISSPMAVFNVGAIDMIGRIEPKDFKWVIVSILVGKLTTSPNGMNGAVEAANKNIKRNCPEDGNHVTRTGMRCYPMLCMATVLLCRSSTGGNPFPLLYMVWKQVSSFWKWRSPSTPCDHGSKSYLRLNGARAGMIS